MRAFATGCHAPDDVGAPCYGLLRVGGGLAACEALEDDAGLGSDAKIVKSCGVFFWAR